MAGEIERDPIREQTERHINRRLRLSKWLRRGVAAACLSAGLFGAYSPDITKTDESGYSLDELDDDAAMLLIASGGVAIMFESAFAQRTCDRRVEEHRAARRAQSAQSNVIRVNFGLPPETRKSVEQPAEPTSKRDVLNAFGYYGSATAAGFGTALFLGPHVNQHFESGYAAPYTVFGGIALGAAAVSAYTARGVYGEMSQSYMQELDEIDELARYRNHQGKSLV